MRRLKRKGQGTLEYLIILAGIIAALVIARSVIQGNVQTAMSDAGTKISTESSRLAGAHP